MTIINIEQLQELLAHNDLVLSRTAASGRIDTAASSLKKSPSISSVELLDGVGRNRSAVSRFIFQQANYKPHTSAEIVGSLLTIAFLTNSGIAAGGLFREWPYVPQVKDFSDKAVAPEDIPMELWNVGDTLLRAARNSSPAERLEVVAGVEWEIGIGALHPFYDGCGRISRYFSVVNSLWFGVPLKRHNLRSEYMGRASEGRLRFIEYYKALQNVF